MRLVAAVLLSLALATCSPHQPVTVTGHKSAKTQLIDFAIQGGLKETLSRPVVRRVFPSLRP
jgi:hypothetical protein